MQFRILGPIEARLGDRLLAISGRRQLALLAFLLVHRNEPVSADTLIDAIWRDDRMDGSSKRLQMAVARLRKALPSADALRFSGGGYVLEVRRGELDTDVFEARVDAGRAALRAGDASAAGTELRAALSIWRGPPLSDVQFAEFAQSEARRLEELRQEANELRIDADLALGKHSELVAELERLLATSPLRERLTAQLMTALYRSGRQADALAVFQRARAVLIDELGLEPGPALRKLQSDILAQTLPAPDSRAVPLPEGTVTLLFTDIEGSTRLIRQLGDAFGRALERHFELLRGTLERFEGVVVEERGDGLFAAFASARAALEAATEAHAALAREPWPGQELKVRIGIHSGEPRLQRHTYWGEDVHYAARLADAANGGQTVVSESTAALAGGADLIDLGRHRLKDFPAARRINQLGEAVFPPLRTLDPMHTNLPGSPGELIGRDRERTELVELVRDGRVRLLTITGAGGTGKTRLALAVVETLLDEFRDGIFFIGLSHVTATADVPGAIGAPLGVRPGPGQSPYAALAAALAERELLLVLDNFEHLLDAAARIAALLEPASGLHVLVTSQAPLRVRGEQVTTLGPLDVPLDNDLDGVLAAPACRMLIDRARTVTPRFKVTSAEAASVAGICRALGGLPLALELAAARLAVLPPRLLLERLEAGVDALGRGPRDLPPRQRGLRAALEWTFGLLTREEQMVLRRQSVFTGAASIERIERVCGEVGTDVLDVVAKLLDLSLLESARDGRFRLHQSVREYARERLRAAGECELVQQRRAKTLATAARAWGRRYLLDREAVQAEVTRDEPDLVDALAWSAEHDEESFACTAGGAGMALLFGARLPRLAGAIETAVSRREALAAEPAAWLSLAAGLVAFQRRELAVAYAFIADAVASAAGSGDVRLECAIRAAGLVIKALAGESQGSRDDQTALRERAAAAGDRAVVEAVEALEPYIVAYCEHRPREATAAFAALMEDGSRTDWAAVGAVYCWPDGLMADGDYARALAGYREALRAARDRFEPPNIALQFEGYVMALSALGRHVEACESAGWADSVRVTAGAAVSRDWNASLAEALRISRTALGNKAADEAYARGRALGLDGAVSAGLALTL